MTPTPQTPNETPGNDEAAEAEKADALARLVADQLLASEGTGGAWGVRIEEVRVGYARIAMTLTREMTNGHGIAHGGMIFALADSAFAYACNSQNETTVAASASIVFLAPGHLGDELVAEAEEQTVRGRSGVTHVLVRKADGTPIAHFQGLSRRIGGPIVKL